MSKSTIEKAGYGCYNQTLDCTSQIQDEYEKGKRVFVADNRFGDPAPGERKYLYIFWETSVGDTASGVTGENDDHGITIP
jgi:hypothetical protein